jgi:kynurenine formamidase
MSVLNDLLSGITDRSIDLIDLTAPLSERTPIIQLPSPFANTQRFSLREISRYDERGPAWYWNDITTGEHVGTHFDAPIHWVTGKKGIDVSQIPPRHLIAPAAVIDKSRECEQNSDFLLEVEHIEAWQQEHGPLPHGWLLYRTGWDARAQDERSFLNADEKGPHTPGISPACARWLAQTTPIIGLGVETVGTDAGAAHSFNPPFPCHAMMLGSGKYGLTQLANLAKLPPTGSVLLVAPLPIVRGSGSPARVLALTGRRG